MVVGAGPLNFFMNRLLFVENSSTEKVEDVSVVEDNSKVLPVKVSRSFSKQRDLAEEEKKKSANSGDLPSLVRTYFHEIAPPLLRGDSFASKSSSSLVSEDFLGQSERSTSTASEAVTCVRIIDEPVSSPSIPPRSPSPPTSRESARETPKPVPKAVPKKVPKPPPEATRPPPPPKPTETPKAKEKASKPAPPVEKERTSLGLNKKFPKNTRRTGSKKKK